MSKQKNYNNYAILYFDGPIYNIYTSGINSINESTIDNNKITIVFNTPNIASDIDIYATVCIPSDISSQNAITQAHNNIRSFNAAYDEMIETQSNNTTQASNSATTRSQPWPAVTTKPPM